ncbi:MAG: thiamine phosphate synthase [Thermoplasmatales archaeon]|jgi:thiamine-phosphate pyrophosphorylase|nr:thiamine phosphate synthase [Thermoplasmatales archaeon]
MYDLYVVTDPDLSLGRSPVEIAALAYEGGADVVQLRDKHADGRQLLEWATGMKELADKHGKLFIVNDRLDIAILSGAHGVHLGQSDIPVAEARKIVPSDFIIGASVKSAEEAVKAAEDRADYLGVTLFETKTKADADPAGGLDLLRRILLAVDVPVVAIGGMNRENAASVIEAGAEGAAFVSAVVSKEDVVQASGDLKAIITASKARR